MKISPPRRLGLGLQTLQPAAIVKNRSGSSTANPTHSQSQNCTSLLVRSYPTAFLFYPTSFNMGQSQSSHADGKKARKAKHVSIAKGAGGRKSTTATTKKSGGLIREAPHGLVGSLVSEASGAFAHLEEHHDETPIASHADDDDNHHGDAVVVVHEEDDDDTTTVDSYDDDDEEEEGKLLSSEKKQIFRSNEEEKTRAARARSSFPFLFF